MHMHSHQIEGQAIALHGQQMKKYGRVQSTGESYAYQGPRVSLADGGVACACRDALAHGFAQAPVRVRRLPQICRIA